MRKIRISILLLLFSFNFHLSAVLNHLVKLQGENTITLLGDHHNPHEKDSEQLLIMRELLSQRDRKTQPLFVGVEVPVQVEGVDLSKKVTGQLCNLNLGNINIENIENRCFSIAALAIFNQEDPQQIEKNLILRIGNSRFVIGQATVSNLCSEFEDQMHILTNWFQVPFKSAEEKLEKAKSDFQKLKELLRGNEQLTLFTLAEEWRSSQQKDTFKKKVDKISGDLFELHMLRTILEKQPRADVAIIAGATHTSLLQGLLRQAEIPFLEERGSFFTGPPLSADDLKLLLKQ